MTKTRFLILSTVIVLGIATSNRSTAILEAASIVRTEINSPVASVASNELLVPWDATWKYLDDGSDQGTAWQALGFDDSGWDEGPAQLGYGEGDEATVVSYGPSATNKYTTTYLRHTFNVADASSVAFLKLSFRRDDGIVIYLNGSEVVRNNMPSGSIGYQTFSFSAIDFADEAAIVQQTVQPAGILVSGNNTLAVEIHQATLTSSDLSFELQVETGDLTEFVEAMWSGAVAPTSAKVNAKIALESNAVRLVVSQNSNLSSPLFSSYTTASQATNNRVAALSITGLTPNTAYFYAIEAEGAVDNSKIGQFTTFADGPFSYTFAVSGDATTGSSHPIYTTIRDQNPLFFLNPGDIFYGAIGVNNRDLFRAAYDATMMSATQSLLYQQVPLSYMWDDNDYGMNNSSASAPGREAARLTYQEYVPHYPLAAGSGNVPIYQSYAVGRAKFILTDLRSERSLGAGTMMGAVQKAWFKQELLSAKGTYPLIFWLNTVPWVSSADNDTWFGFSAERTEIANFIKDNGIEGVVIISADAHMLALDDGTNSDYATGGGAALPVLHMAALDRTGSIIGGPYSHGTFAGAGQFGLITVTDAGGSQICLDFSGLKRNDGDGSLTELIDWGSCFTTAAPAVEPVVAGAPDNDTLTTLRLSWGAEAANCDYQVHEKSEPYFEPMSGTLLATTNGSLSYGVPFAIGDPAENHFYKVVAVSCNGSSTAVSNHVGEFDFAITPGTP